MTNINKPNKKSVVIFKDRIYAININVLWLLERHKKSPEPNIIIIIKINILSVTVDRVKFSV